MAHYNLQNITEYCHQSDAIKGSHSINPAEYILVEAVIAVHLQGSLCVQIAAKLLHDPKSRVSDVLISQYCKTLNISTL